MIVGLVVLIGLVVIRLQAPVTSFPDKITLPSGETAAAYTQGRGWYGVVTESNQIIIYDATTGDIRKTIDVE